MPLLLEDSGEGWYEVEAIWGHRITKGRRPKLQYVIKWRGYGEEHNEWYNAKDLADGMVGAYWEERGETPPTGTAQ